jgi:CRISPR-associated endoribonuclease Cas6
MKIKSGDSRNVIGKHTHGFFFKEMLGSQNPELAEYLHSPTTPKPYSISYLNKAGDLYWFRVASWMDAISETVFSYFRSNFKIFLGNCTFELVKTCSDRKKSSWALRQEVPQFILNCLRTFKDTFWLEHFSPTSFKRGDSHLPLPSPDLIVKSILRQAPHEIKEFLSTSVDELCTILQLKQHSIKSIYNRKNYGSITSFIGDTQWQLSKTADEKQAQDLWILMNFAFLSGIGVKTTQGMGMVRIK